MSTYLKYLLLYVSVFGNFDYSCKHVTQSISVFRDASVFNHLLLNLPLCPLCPHVLCLKNLKPGPLYNQNLWLDTDQSQKAKSTSNQMHNRR